MFPNKLSSVRIHPEGRKISKEQELALKQLNLAWRFFGKRLESGTIPMMTYLSHVFGFTGIDNQGLWA